jgi:hypothetical protein
MSFKAKIAAGAATLALAGGGLGIAGTLSASAATPSCGGNCDNWYTQEFHWAYVLDVLHGRASTGNEIILFQASSSDPAEDFLDQDLGTVDSYYSHHRHLISPGLAHAYGRDDFIEIRYEPLGRPSGFCVGTWPGEAAQAGFKIRLESCSQTGSLFIKDMADKSGDYIPLITGTDTNYGDPLVLNYPAGRPSDMPRPWLNVQPLSTYSTHPPRVYNSQLWNDKMGVLP